MAATFTLALGGHAAAAPSPASSAISRYADAICPGLKLDDGFSRGVLLRGPSRSSSEKTLRIAVLSGFGKISQKLAPMPTDPRDRLLGYWIALTEQTSTPAYANDGILANRKSAIDALDNATFYCSMNWRYRGAEPGSVRGLEAARDVCQGLADIIWETSWTTAKNRKELNRIQARAEEAANLDSRWKPLVVAITKMRKLGRDKAGPFWVEDEARGAACREARLYAP